MYAAKHTCIHIHAHTCRQTYQHWYRHEHTCIHHVACLYHQCSIKRSRKIEKIKKVVGGDKCDFIFIYTNTSAKQQAHMHACRSIHQHDMSSHQCVHTLHWRSTGACVCSCIALTMSFASVSAPWATSASRHATCPIKAAHMRAVHPV